MSKRSSSRLSRFYRISIVVLLFSIVTVSWYLLTFQAAPPHIATPKPTAPTHTLHTTPSTPSSLQPPTSIKKPQTPPTLAPPKAQKPFPAETQPSQTEAYRPTPLAKREHTPAPKPPIRKPRLVIIIDDVHTKGQLRTINALGFRATASIFPPYRLAPHTERLTAIAKHYMIHLPLESGSRKLNTQSGTLLRSFDEARIDRAVAKLRTLFPDARLVNNHTGSRFTADKEAMQRLYEALKRYDFLFVDSRTTSHTQAPAVVREYGDVYLARDVFLDNKKDPAYIRRQLKKAVRLAKKRGYAVAIGHPHPVTLRTLKHAKAILKEVEVVYMDELARSLA